MCVCVNACIGQRSSRACTPQRRMSLGDRGPSAKIVRKFGSKGIPSTSFRPARRTDQKRFCGGRAVGAFLNIPNARQDRFDELTDDTRGVPTADLKLAVYCGRLVGLFQAGLSTSVALALALVHTRSRTAGSHFQPALARRTGMTRKVAHIVSTSPGTPAFAHSDQAQPFQLGNSAGLVLLISQVILCVCSAH